MQQPLTDEYLESTTGSAIYSSDPDCVQRLLQEPIPDHISKLKAFKLVKAAFAGDEPLATRLLSQRASPNFVATIRDRYSLSATFAACDQGHASIVQKLLSAKADPNCPCRYGGAYPDPDDNGRTALEQACRHAHVDCVKALLSAGADAARTHTDVATSMFGGCFKDSALTLALEYGRRLEPRHSVDPKRDFRSGRSQDFERVTSIVKLLLDAKASLTAEQRWIGAPLNKAIGSGYLEAAKLILEAGVDPRIPSGIGSDTPLAALCELRGGSSALIMDLASSMIERKASPEQGCADKKTPLHEVSATCRADLLQLCLAHCSSTAVNRTANGSGTPLLLACGLSLDDIEGDLEAFAAKERLKSVALLIAAGASVNQDYDGCYPIHAAVMKNDVQVVHLLLQAAAMVDTPLLWRGYRDENEKSQTRRRLGELCGCSPIEMALKMHGDSAQMHGCAAFLISAGAARVDVAKAAPYARSPALKEIMAAADSFGDADWHELNADMRKLWPSEFQLDGPSPAVDWQSTVPASFRAKRCANCDTHSKHLLQCNGCRKVHYCDAACQKAHWKSGHKWTCKHFQHPASINGPGLVLNKEQRDLRVAAQIDEVD